MGSNPIGDAKSCPQLMSAVLLSIGTRKAQFASSIRTTLSGRHAPEKAQGPFLTLQRSQGVAGTLTYRP